MSRSARWPALLLVAVLGPSAAACGGSSRSAGPTASPSSAASTTAPSSTVPVGGAGSASSAPTTAPSSTGTSTPPPSSALSSALVAAYRAETGQLATYRNVINALGSVGPFPNIVGAEGQHVSTVTGLLDRYGVAVPPPATGQASPTTVRAACSLGVTLEQQIIALYADQIPKVAAYPDVSAAFQTLQSAARESHLPAFQRCA